jgi:hypothetical protein
MADLSDVEEALAGLVAGVLYPAGPQAPSILGVVCRIHRGWPAGPALDAALAEGRVTASVLADPRPHALTTRHAESETVVAAPAPVLTLAVQGRTATVGGIAAEGQVAGLLVGGLAVVHRTERGDTPEMVAAVLATYLRTRHIVTVEGASLTVAGTGPMLGRVVADRRVRRETRRQRQNFRITLWCPTPALRDMGGAAVDGHLAATDFIELADGTRGRVLSRGSSVSDHARRARLYRRDLVYAVDYATTLTETKPAMIFGEMALCGPPPFVAIG